MISLAVKASGVSRTGDADRCSKLTGVGTFNMLCSSEGNIQDVHSIFGLNKENPSQSTGLFEIWS
jgi:hypothetical protein